MPDVPAFRRLLRQEDYREFQTSLGYGWRLDQCAVTQMCRVLPGPGEDRMKAGWALPLHAGSHGTHWPPNPFVQSVPGRHSHPVAPGPATVSFCLSHKAGTVVVPGTQRWGGRKGRVPGGH